LPEYFSLARIKLKKAKAVGSEIMIGFKKVGLEFMSFFKKKSSLQILTYIDEFSARIISDLPGFISNGGRRLPPPCPLVSYAFDTIQKFTEIHM